MISEFRNLSFGPMNKKCIRFCHCDCIEGMSTHIQEKSVDMVVTSPPYNIGVKYGAYNDSLERNEYLEWIDTVGIAVKRVLNNQGSFFLNIGNRPSDQWIAWDVANTLRKHFILQNTITWIKSIAIEKKDVGDYPNLKGDISPGHFKPVNSSKYLNDCFEYIFHFTKNGDVELDKLAGGLAIPYQDKSNIGRYFEYDKRDRGNNWFIPYETIKNRSDRPHPATFPIKLPEMCIKLHGQRDDLVILDPFCGIGSTAVACTRLGVSFIGFDVDKDYLSAAEERVNIELSTQNKSSVVRSTDLRRYLNFQLNDKGQKEKSFFERRIGKIRSDPSLSNEERNEKVRRYENMKTRVINKRQYQILTIRIKGLLLYSLVESDPRMFNEIIENISRCNKYDEGDFDPYYDGVLFSNTMNLDQVRKKDFPFLLDYHKFMQVLPQNFALEVLKGIAEEYQSRLEAIPISDLKFEVTSRFFAQVREFLWRESVLRFREIDDVDNEVFSILSNYHSMIGSYVRRMQKMISALEDHMWGKEISYNRLRLREKSSQK